MNELFALASRQESQSDCCVAVELTLAFDLNFTPNNYQSLNQCNPWLMHVFIASQSFIKLCIKGEPGWMKNRNSMTCQISHFRSCKPLREQHITLLQLLPLFCFSNNVVAQCSICYKRAVSIIHCLLILCCVIPLGE